LNFKNLGRQGAVLAAVPIALSLSTALLWPATVCSQSAGTATKLEELRNMLPAIDEQIRNKPTGELMYLRGSANAALKNYQAAEADFDAAEAFHYNDHAFEFNGVRGLTYLVLRKYNQAIGALTKALALQPNSAGCLTNRGSAYFELGRYREALDDCLRSLHFETKWSTPYSVIGACYFKSAQYPYGLQYENLAIQKDPRNFDAYHYRALIYEKQGKADLAAKDAAIAAKLGYSPTAVFQENRE
jgi:tetratricopeptide (TPR) repeat protein